MDPRTSAVVEQPTKMEEKKMHSILDVHPATSAGEHNTGENHPDYLYPLIFREGSILRPELSRKTAVCVIANACGKTAYATSGVLEREYAHADLYRC